MAIKRDFSYLKPACQQSHLVPLLFFVINSGLYFVYFRCEVNENITKPNELCVRLLFSLEMPDLIGLQSQETQSIIATGFNIVIDKAYYFFSYQRNKKCQPAIHRTTTKVIKFLNSIAFIGGLGCLRRLFLLAYLFLNSG